MSQFPFQDKILICSDCGEEFVFTASAQEYFLERGFAAGPSRCKACYSQLKKNKRKQRKNRPRHRSHGHGDYPATNR